MELADLTDILGLIIQINKATEQKAKNKENNIETDPNHIINMTSRLEAQFSRLEQGYSDLCTKCDFIDEQLDFVNSSKKKRMDTC